MLPPSKGATSGRRGWGVRTPPPKKKKNGRTNPTFFVAAHCSARNWLNHPYFVLYNNLDQGIGPPTLKTWLRPCLRPGSDHTVHRQRLGFSRVIRVSRVRVRIRVSIGIRVNLGLVSVVRICCDVADPRRGNRNTVGFTLTLCSTLFATSQSLALCVSISLN